MENIQRATVDEKIKNGYSFELGNYLSEGFKIFGKEWVLFSLYGLVSSLILIVSMFTVFGFALLVYPTLLGFSVAAEKVEKGERLEFSDFFGAFKNFGQHFLLGLVFLLSYALVFIPYFVILFYASGGGVAAETASVIMVFAMLFMFAMIIGIYFIQVAVFFAPYLVHYGGYSAGEAIGTSFKLAKKNFWWLLLFVFVVGIIAGIGQYACIIGMFASVAAAMLINYSLVKNVLMTQDYSEIEEIGSQAYH